MKTISATFASLLSVDGILTYWAVSTGGFTEVNPLMAAWAGEIAFPIYKIVTAWLVAALVTWVVNRYPATRKVTGLGMVLLSLLYIGILTSNLLEVFSA